MEDHSAQKALAENYFVEMLEAERDQDYDAWCKRWIKNDLGGITREVFMRDVAAMDETLGAYKERQYLGYLRGRAAGLNRRGESVRLRFVWRVIYERNEALFVVGIHQVDEAWYVYENMCSM